MPSSMEMYPTTENAKLEYQIQMNRDLVEPKRNVDRIYTLGKLYFSKIILVMDVSSTPHPLGKVNSTYSLTASTLSHRVVLLSVCFIYPLSGQYIVQTATGKVDRARKLKCTTAARGLSIDQHMMEICGLV